MSSALLSSSSIAAFAVGTGLYWGYFNRYETHLYGLRYINTFLLANIAGFIALTYQYELGLSATISALTSASSSLLVALFGNCLVYRIFLNPLNKFPGPYGKLASDRAQTDEQTD
jgi:tryprostatin B 6-hydroxylase